jgi:hypothetical protein
VPPRPTLRLRNGDDLTILIKRAGRRSDRRLPAGIRRRLHRAPCGGGIRAADVRCGKGSWLPVGQVAAVGGHVLHTGSARPPERRSGQGATGTAAGNTLADPAPANGQPVLCCHGVPSSRLDFRILGSSTLAERLGLRVIAVDRPGYGFSNFQLHRKIGDWPADVAALADGINPQSRSFFRLNRDRPVVGRLLDRLMAFGARRYPVKFIAKTVSSLPPPDRKALREPRVARAYVDAVCECFRSGARGGSRLAGTGTGCRGG